MTLPHVNVLPDVDERHMRSALAIARRALGRVWPNPAVGCVIVKNGRVVGRGHTAEGGRPHAETVALEQAGAYANGATAYISLEPCDHQGQTPPCTQALIAAGIKRCVIACEDPDPRVNGMGIARLEDAGIKVTSGVCAAEARAINEGFFLRVTHNRPLVTLKLASSLDGKIATHTGESRWITGEDARRYVHVLRASHDAVMIGSGTALIDDPELTCRLNGINRHPVRIVLDSRLRLPLTSKLVETAHDVPLWMVTIPGNDEARLRAYKDLGVKVIESRQAENGMLSLQIALNALAERGLTRVLCEGGAHIAASLIRDKLVDQMAWFRASRIIGADGRAAVMPFGVDSLGQTADFVLSDTQKIGQDIVEFYARAL